MALEQVQPTDFFAQFLKEWKRKSDNEKLFWFPIYRNHFDIPIYAEILLCYYNMETQEGASDTEKIVSRAHTKD